MNCRLLGILSVTKKSSPEYLYDNEYSLFQQSFADEERKQEDGWGIGYYDEQDTVNVIKSCRPAYEEQEKFKTSAQKIRAHIILAHLRRASNPLKLPLTVLRTIEATQPFTWNNYLFVHNGSIDIPKIVEDNILTHKYRKLKKGHNDSEILFLHLLQNLETDQNFIPAIQRCESELWCANELNVEESIPYSALNLILSDGKRMYCVCKYNEKYEDLKTLCGKKNYYFRLRYCLHQDRLIVASEPTDRSNDWKILNNGRVLMAEVSQGEIKLTIGKL